MLGLRNGAQWCTAYRSWSVNAYTRKLLQFGYGNVLKFGFGTLLNPRQCFRLVGSVWIFSVPNFFFRAPSKMEMFSRWYKYYQVFVFCQIENLLTTKLHHFSWGQRCRSSTTNSSSFTIRTRTGEVVFPTWRHLVWLAADVHGSFSLRGNPFWGVTCFGEKWHLTHDAFDPRVFRTM